MKASAKGRPFKSRAPLFLFLYIFLVIILLFGAFFFYLSLLRKQVAIDTAETYMTSLSAVHRYYSEEIVERALAGGLEFASDYENYPDRIPFPGTVAMDLGDKLEAANSNLKFSLYSDYPFPWRADRNLDSFERTSLDFFAEHPDQSFMETMTLEGRDFIRFAVPVTMRQACVDCHNRQEFAFDRHWQVGEFRGGRQVSVPLPGPGQLPGQIYAVAIVGALVIGGLGMGFVLPIVGRLEKVQRSQQAELELISTMIAASPAGLFLTDSDQNLLVVSQSMARLAGRLPEQMVGLSLKDCYAKSADWELDAQLFAEIKAGAPSQPWERDFKGGGGRTLPVRLFIAPVTLTKGQSPGYFGFVQDISGERERAARMQEMQRMDAMGRLAGGVAHDFNNLLMVITGNLELVQESRRYDQSSLDRVERAAKQAEELTSNLLSFTRQYPQSTVVIDTHRVLQEFSSMLLRVFEQHAAVTLRFASGLWPLDVDRGQLREALLNLALNARDATGKSDSVILSARNVKAYQLAEVGLDLSEGKQRDFVLIQFSDTGVGIAADNKAKVFEPFFSTKDAGQGSGLGLSMVYGFAAQSGGHVILDSHLGKGTSVKVFLPRHQEAVASACSKAEDDPS